MIKGHLRHLVQINEDDSCEGFFVFVPTDKSISPIEHIDNVSNAPLNTPIKANISHTTLVSWEYLPVMAKKNLSNKNIALIRIKPVGELKERDFRLAESNAKNLEFFLKSCNKGEWESVEVTGYAVENVENSGYGMRFDFDSVIPQMREQHPDKVDHHNYWHGWAGNKPGTRGEAYVDHTIAWTYAGNQRTMRHEQGHNFGCNHSRTFDDPYGHDVCVMARADTGFCGAANINLNQIDGDNDIPVAQSGKTYFLAPVESTSDDLRPGECHMLELSRTTQTNGVFVSYRKNRDQSLLGLQRFDNEVLIEGGSISSPILLERVKVGETKEMVGFMVTNLGHKDGVIQLGIDVDTLKDYPPPQTPLPSDINLKDTSLSGLWHNPEHKHQGVDITIIPKRNQLVGYWFTHSARGPWMNDNGKRWYILDGELKNDGQFAEITIYYCKNRERVKVGYGTIAIYEGVMKMRTYTNSFGRETLHLTQLTPPKESVELWSTGQLEGYSIAQYNGKWVAYYYGHEDNNVNWHVYEGEDERELSGYSPEGKIKLTYEKEIKQIPSINLHHVRDTGDRIL